MKQFKIAFMSVLAAGAALCCGSLFAEENKYIGANNGSWFDDANWSLNRAPEASDDVVVESRTVVATDTAGLTATDQPIKVNSLTLNGANLTIGDKSTHVHPVIAGDVTLTGRSFLTVCAGEIPESKYDEVFDTEVHTLAGIRAAANIVTIGGNFTVDDTSVVYPETAVLTGVPVIFRVAGKFKVSASASFDARARGWGWKDGNYADRPSDCCKPGGVRGTKNDAYGWTLAIGVGEYYTVGAVYGGNQDATVLYGGGGWNYAQSYGPTFAPIFSGSPAGSAGTGANARGSGSIVVLAAGTAEINGKLYADGEKSTGSKASGGGIWLAASGFTFGDNALLTAKGPNGAGWQTGPGGGGRIALAEGCSKAQIDTMFEGGWPNGVIEIPAIEGVAVDVSGGVRDDGSGLLNGSVSTVRPSDDPDAEVNMFVGPHSGDWLVADNWSNGQVPQSTDRVVIREKSVFMPGSITVRSLTLETASLRLGNKTDHIAPVIAGDLTLNGVSKLYVSAGEISESDYETVFDTVEHTLAELRSKANIVTIRGNFTVNDTSVVYPEAAVLTGVPVVFAVSNDFTLAEGASFDATGLGWGWQDGKWSECQHQSVCKPGRNGWNIQDSDGWTLAIGAGMDYAYGGIYGGNRSFDSFQEKSYSGSYGPTFAPIFSGSPGGSAGTAANVRGSGSIVVLAQGSAVVDGILTADSVNKHNSCASGGGIWLAASAFTFGANAKLTAKGLDSPRDIYGGGGGGRIAIAEGCSQAQVYAMFNGAIPEGAVETLDITGVAVDVEGGINGNTSGISGSLSTVRAGSVLTTQSDVAELSAAGVVWGDEELLNGTYVRTAPQYAYSLRDGTLRYTCKGFVVSNAVEQVAEGPGLTATVEIDSETGPFTLTWRWGDPTTVDPEPVSRCWVGPEEGGVFADYWNWDPAGTPTRVDELYVTNVTLSVSKVEVGKLVLSSANLMVVDADEFIVNGDMELGGNSIWTITALPTNGTATAYADGATHVVVGGNLALADTATVKPISDRWTGGSAVFTVAGNFTLGASAKFDAVSTGWSWIEYTGEPSPSAVATTTTEDKTHTYQTMAPGYGIAYATAGGSYGGRGGGRPATGWTYGFANAPFYPGSPNGTHNTTSYVPGGGLIRIHVAGKATVNGVLNASAGDSGYGGASGGGIWLTAARFAFGATAQLLAKGGPSHYSSQGGGGRIAIGTGLTASQMASLLATGTCVRKVYGFEDFQAAYPGVTVNVERGDQKSWGPDGDAGTFSYYPAPKGLAIFIK